MHFVESTNFIFQERQETHQKEADQEERRTPRQTNQGDYLKIVNKNNYYFNVHDDVCCIFLLLIQPVFSKCHNIK